MQGTNQISYENCGRRFYLFDYAEVETRDTVSGRGQNWIDADGSASGLYVPTFIVSGLPTVRDWVEVDDDGTFRATREGVCFVENVPHRSDFA